MKDQSPYGLQRFFEFRNDTGVMVPAFGIIKITDVLSDVAVKIGLPTAAKEWLHAVNGPRDVAVGERGECTMDFPTWALYESGAGTPANGEIWKPSAGSFKLTLASNDEGNFPIYGGADGNRVVVGPPFCNCG